MPNPRPSPVFCKKLHLVALELHYSRDSLYHPQIFSPSFFQVPKMEVRIFGYFWAWSFPYISRIHTAYMTVRIPNHFRYLKCLVIFWKVGFPKKWTSGKPTWLAGKSPIFLQEIHFQSGSIFQPSYLSWSRSVRKNRNGRNIYKGENPRTLKLPQWVKFASLPLKKIDGWSRCLGNLGLSFKNETVSETGLTVQLSSKFWKFLEFLKDMVFVCNFFQGNEVL